MVQQTLNSQQKQNCILAKIARKLSERQEIQINTTERVKKFLQVRQIKAKNNLVVLKSIQTPVSDALVQYLLSHSVALEAFKM